ncbi:MAG: 23S rRNA (pseudouridine(1915)-N(3))-methyltransferase RlmH [Erysipelotrichaceae bacterium]|nr:23S rRNA (pseudouridine(1915)-N(3))-methyltransferase RlmH [Erysipelotrichaceae bacterium]MDY6035211.1 23S rRNA (pseudouridine(1915)-N(3))-methyltransferase RlmH [Bulleidia sp.]
MIKIIACGKVKEKWMKDGIAEYTKRIRPYDKIEMIEVADEKAPESNSPAENEQVKQAEGERLLKSIRDDEFVILLDLAGQDIDSVMLANKIQDCYNQGKSKITFVIGGSLGLSKDVIQRANFRWRISKATFPHQLCRILVVEQVYRSFRILHNEPYHK